MHVFPQLRKLEDKYRNELTVVGVHSAKFTAEKDTANVRKAVLRYEIEHPVINDSDFEVWKRDGGRAWPTIMFGDPAGKVVGKHEGEISFESFDKLLGDMVAEFDGRELLTKGPLAFHLEKEKEWERPLSFPGKVLADGASERLFIADSNHNRTVVTSLAGKGHQQISTGAGGLRGGEADRVRVPRPGHGRPGPTGGRVAYGTTLEPEAGLSSIMGYPGRGPQRLGIAYLDPLAGIHAASAVMMGLWHRRKTGRGQHIDLAQVAAAIGAIGEVFRAYQLTGQRPERLGNHHATMAPHGCYACKGEDSWLALRRSRTRFCWDR